MIKTLQLDIIKRFYNDKELTAFMQSYEEAKLRTGGRLLLPPTPKQERLAKLAKEFGYKTAGLKVGVPTEVVYAAVNRVAKYNYMVGSK